MIQKIADEYGMNNYTLKSKTMTMCGNMLQYAEIVIDGKINEYLNLQIEEVY